MEGFGNHLTIDNHSQLVFAIFAHYYLFPFLFSVYFLQKRKNKNKRTILALDLWEGFSNILKQKEKISGIFVHGKEYGFGAHDFPISGVFEVEPKSCPGFIYRCSILLGCINMSFSEFRALIESVASEYHGDTYHLISKNCNHFTEDIVHRLTGKHIPGWVNRLARIGSLCSCLLPESLQVTTVKQLPEYHEMGMLLIFSADFKYLNLPFTLYNLLVLIKFWDFASASFGWFVSRRWNRNSLNCQPRRLNRNRRYRSRKAVAVTKRWEFGYIFY
uniref:PPPDE domain-containing protein n=1 Tax=Gossypium raimondii TaxID=29730 RepID=A0A0D2UET2_GOSRA|nr:hypothetical protein B456_009G020000 [Gossypium raimondii]